MLKSARIDAVIVAVPSGTHGEVAVKAAKAGKHVLVEKPLEVTLEKIDAIMTAVREAGVVCGPVSQYRFTDGMRELKRTVDSGELGDLVLGDAYLKWYRPQEYYDSGGWRHYIDQLLWVMGEVESVQAQTGTLAHERIEVEDTACIVLRFKNGSIGVIEASTAIYPGSPARLEIHGTRGTMILEGERIVYRGIRDEEEFRAEADSESSSGSRQPMDINLGLVVAQVSDFCEAVLAGREPSITMEDGRRAVALILAAYESAKTGRIVQLDEYAGPAGA